MPKVKTSSAPRGMGTITPNANGTHTLRWYDSSAKRQVEETFSTRDLATDRQAEIWRAKRAGEQVFAGKGRSDSPFMEACAAWIERSPDRGESTRVIYRSTIKHLAPLNGRSLRWVAEHPAEIQALITSLPPSYRKRSKVMITGTLNTATDDGLISGHRINRRNVRAGKDAPVKPAPEFGEDIEELIGKLAVNIDPRYALMVHLGRGAGLRIGESLGLNRDDIITKANGKRYIKVRRQRGADGKVTMSTKTDSSAREIPLGDYLAGKLADAPVDADGYYFPVMWRKSVYDLWNAAKDAVGLPGGFTPHHLRHYFASYLLSRNIRLDLVSYWLGHADVKLTAAVYAHALPQDEDRVRDLL